MDERQASIVYQNQSRLAFDILVHNTRDKPIDPKDVVELALKLTRVAVNPVPHMQKQMDKEKK